MNDDPQKTSASVVIVGAGVAGLAAALRLSHAGRDVVVVEQAAGPGGKMRTAPSVAGPVDIGPTVMTMRPVFEQLFADVGERLTDHLTLTADTVLARHWWRDGSTLDLFADAEQSADAVGRFAGAKAAEEFRRFSGAAQRLYEAFEAPIMKAGAPDLMSLTAHVLRHPGLIPALAPGLSLARSLGLRFSDPRLRQLFGRYATYVGGSPYQSPAVLGLIWHSEASGVWSVAGGMHRVAQTLHGLAAARGAAFRFGRSVRGITPTPDGGFDVSLSDGGAIRADQVLFNGDPKALADGLLGDAPRKAVPRKAVKGRSLSAFVWGFAATPEGVDLSHHNVFCCADPRVEFGDIAKGRMPRDATLYLCAQDRGAGAVPDGPERFEIIMNGPPGHVATVEDKERCRTRTFETLQTMGLTFSPTPPLAALTTPSDFAAAFPASDGSLYGLSPHGMMATFNRPTARSKLRGLYLCGGGAHPGAGIPMACLSGGHAAAAMQSDHALTSTSRPMAMRGGMSTASATMASAPSRSSVS